MNFIESITTCFKKYVEFKGSASRSEHNYFVLFTSILGLIAVAIDGGPDGLRSRGSPIMSRVLYQAELQALPKINFS